MSSPRVGLRALLLTAGCAAPLDDNSGLITEERLLAVVARPAEVAPGEAQALAGVWAGPEGLLPEAPLGWGLCLRPKPLAELGPAAPECLEAESEALERLPDGPTVSLSTPVDACSLFGPNPPPPLEGEDPGRPADPDITGGFYQPVAVFAPGAGAGDPAVGLASTRLRCGLANVSQETYVAWNEGYHNNAAPEVESIRLRVDGADLDLTWTDAAAAAARVPAGATVDLRLTWPDCPLEPSCGDGICGGGETVEGCPDDCGGGAGACGGAETYIVHSPGTEALDLVREAISVAWFTTGGALGSPRAGRAEDDTARSVDGQWRAPSAGEELLVAVVRDSRGGITALSLTLTVE